MTLRPLALIAAAALAAMAAGPAGSVDRPDQPKPPSQCFHTSMINGFAAPDDENLYIRVGVNDVYHFTMLTHCQDLDWDQRVALVARSGGFICHALDAEVVARATGLGRQRCAIKSMEKLTPAEIAALPKHAKP